MADERILVTGAGGFVGAALVRALAPLLEVGDTIVAADIHFAERLVHPRISYHEARLDTPGTIDTLFATPFDRIFHLATVAGVGSKDFDRGKATNLDATVALLDAARASGRVPRLVYSSSVGVFGSPLPDLVNDDTPAFPNTSYGTHKLICEILINDYTRAGFIDGISLRISGVIARPENSTTMLSAFLSDVFYAAQKGAAFALPLGPNDRTWVMSLRAVIANLIHAGSLPTSSLHTRRNWTLPSLLVRMDELVAALARVYGQDRIGLLTFRPDPATQSMFAQVPLVADGARSLGFIGDADVTEFVDNVIAGRPGLRVQPR